MKIEILQHVMALGSWHEPGVGEYEPRLAQHLISIGAARAYETKVLGPDQLKKKPGDQAQQSPASQPAPALPVKTATRRGRSRTR